VAAAVRLGDSAFLAAAPLLLATGTACALELLSCARPLSGYRAIARAGAVAAALVAGLAAFAPLAEMVKSAARYVAPPWRWWNEDGVLASADAAHAAVAPWLALATAAVVVTLSAVAAGRLRRLGPLLVAAGIGLALLATLYTSSTTAIVALCLAACALLLAGLLRPGAVSVRFRGVVLGGAVAAEAAAFVFSFPLRETWLAASLAAVAVCLIAGHVTVLARPSAVRRQASLVCGALLLCATAATAPVAWGAGQTMDADTLRNSTAALVLVAGIALIVVGTPVLRTMPWSDRRAATLALGWPAGGALALHAVIPSAPATAGQSVAVIAGDAAVVAGEAAILAVIAVRQLQPPAPRGGSWPWSAMWLAPVLWLTLSDALILAGIRPTPVLAAVAATAASGLALALGTLSGTGARAARRRGIEIGAAAIGAFAVGWAVVADESTWLVLLMLALGVLQTSISVDGLFASASRRRHAGWLALALGTAGMWSGLASRGGTADGLEAYVLPVTAALVVIGGLIQLSDRRHDAPPRTGTISAVTLVGLLFSIVPLSVAGSGGGAEARPVLVWTSCAVLSIGAAAIRRWVRSVPALDALAVAGLVGVLLVAAERAVRVFFAPDDAVTLLDLTTASSVAVVLLSCTVMLSLRPHGRPVPPVPPVPRWYRTAGSAFVVVALTVATSIETSLIARMGGELRMTITVAVLSCLTVAAVATARPPLTPRVGLVAIILGSVAAAASLTVLGWAPPERVTAPVAGALLVSAWILSRPSSSPDRPDVPLSFGGACWAAGLVLALGPSVLSFTAEDWVRPLAVLAIGALLILAAALRLRALPAGYRVMSAVVGGAAVATTGLDRAIAAWLTEGHPTPAFDGWLALAAAVLAAGGGAALWRVGVGQARDAALPAALLLSAYAVIALPELVAVPESAWLRPTVLLATGCALALGAALLRSRTPRPLVLPTDILMTMSIAISAAVVLLRVLPLVAEGTASGSLADAWALPFAATLIAVAWVLAQEAEPARVRNPALPPLIALVAVIVVSGLQLAMVIADAYAAPRALATVYALSALHVLTRLRPKAPFTPVVGAVALGCAGVLAVLPIDAPPIELRTAPIAVALLIPGVHGLRATPGRGSWALLGPGCALLMAPSLLADLTDSPLWRVTALGILAVAMTLIGASKRLQAPFLLGCGVALTHGIAQLWPWIATAYTAVPWWLWLGIGGAALIAVAARYEKRMNELKSVALTVRAMR
jgi:hypothetical protein